MKTIFKIIAKHYSMVIGIGTFVCGSAAGLIAYGVNKANKAHDYEELKKDVKMTKEIVISSQKTQEVFISNQTSFNDSMRKCMIQLKIQGNATQEAVKEIIGQSNLTNDRYRSIMELLYYNKESSELKKKELPYITMQ